ncbi:MAG: EpsG family protein [Bacteroidales bacterium]|nr:EpsG family protein [Bacteroidales bacterium]
MIEILPAKLYHPIFLILSAILTIYYYSQLQQGIGLNNKKRGYGIMLFYAIAFIIVVGLRPVSGFYFGDTSNYAASFEQLKGTPFFGVEDERIFHYLTWLCAQTVDVHVYFLIVEILYIVPVLIACKKICPTNPAVMMLFFMTAFSFFSYGTNGIRNGMACSLVILAIAYALDKRLIGKIIAALLVFIAYECHKSIVLPIASMIVCLFFKNTRLIIYFWILSIGISLVAGGSVEAFFTSLGFDDRMSEYSSSNVDESLFSSTGFRWDFLLYSAMPIILGWYAIFKRGIVSEKYSYLLNIYILCNAFWVMMIRASYSNRFAYLSWFIYPIVLAYPLLNFKVFKKGNNQKVALILIAHTAFTIIMSFM